MSSISTQKVTTAPHNVAKFFAVIPEMQFPWQERLRWVAAILFIATDDCKERCIATAAISAALALLAVQAALYLSVINGGSL